MIWNSSCTGVVPYSSSIQQSAVGMHNLLHVHSFREACLDAAGHTVQQVPGDEDEKFVIITGHQQLCACACACHCQATLYTL